MLKVAPLSPLKRTPSLNQTQANGEDQIILIIFIFGGTLFSVYGGPQGSKDLLLINYDNSNQLTASHRTDELSNWAQQKVVFNTTNLYNKYHHIVMVRDGKKQIISLYIDGKLVSEKSVAPAASIGNYPAFIGKHNSIDPNPGSPNRVGYSNFFKGKMDYLRIHKRALSAKRIHRIYKRKSATPYKKTTTKKSLKLITMDTTPLK